MKKQQIMWAIIIMVAFNLLIIAWSQVGNIKDTFRARMTSTIWWEALALVIMSTIPILNIIALVIIVPVLFYNIWFRVPPMLKAFNQSSSVLPSISQQVIQGQKSPSTDQPGLTS